ncbi:MAG: type II CAAX endopeptidase family protein [Andreesenia angusta]|nr:type II CAAX endopeptidase family protein [Andreesenia angusta]
MENIQLSTESKNITKRKFSRIGLSLSSIFLISVLSQFIGKYILDSINPNLANKSWTIWIYFSLMYILGLPIFYLLLRNLPKYERGDKKDLKLTQFLAFFTVSISAIYIFNLVGLIINLLIMNITNTEIINPLDELLNGTNKYLIMFFTAIIAPIVEEFIFRKVILNRVRFYGDKFAIFYTAILFGLFHGNFSQFFYATALGMIFAYIAIKTNSIKYTIILHMIINFMGGFLPLAIVEYVTNPNSITLQGMGIIAAYSLIVLSVFIIGLIVFFKYRKNIRLEPPNNKFFNVNNLNKKAYLNIGMLIFYIVCIIQFITVINGVFTDTQ